MQATEQALPEALAGGFDTAAFAQLAALEERNFWFKARNSLILWALGKFFPKCRSMLEIGCGTGYVLSGIARRYPTIALTGSELFEEGLEFARKRLPAVRLMQLDATELPFSSAFDVIGAFDVLEHITDDELVLSQVFEAVKPDGGLLVTVPQHQWLWSRSDELAMHVRRYSKDELVSKVSTAGFTVEYCTSFVSLLLPLMWLSRWRQRSSNYSVLDELAISGPLNTVLEMVLHFERWFIQMGLSLPMGGSLLLVAKKSAVR